MTSRLSRSLLPYGVAIASTAIALQLTVWLKPVMLHTIGALFYMAVVVSTRYGGFRSGFVAIVLSVLSLYFYLLPLYPDFAPDEFDTFVPLIIFTIVALTINVISASLKTSKRKLEALSQHLQEESNDRLKTALTAAQMGLWDWNMVTGEIRWSPEHEQLFGLAPGSFDGRYETFNRCVHPEDRAVFGQVIDRSIQNQVPYHHEFRVLWADGSVHWIEGRGQAFYDKAGQPICMSGTVMAIDQRKQAEVKLQEREVILRLFAQYAPAGMAMLDQTMCYIMASQQWVDEYNLESVEALINRSHYDIFPEIPDLWRQIHQRCLAGAIEKCDEDLFVRADGTQQWISWEIRPWYTASDEIGGIIIFSVDITRRKQAELALQESEEKLRLFVKYAPAGIVMFDRDMRYLAASQRWVDELRLPSIESLIGRSHYKVFPNLDERLKQSNQRALAGQVEKCNEDLFIHSDGVQQWFRWETHPWYTNQGDVGGLILFAEDITEQKQAEITLQNLNIELEHRVIERTAEMTELNDRLINALLEQRRAKQEVEDLYNRAPCGYHSLDANGTFVRINDTELNWLGYTRDELLNQKTLFDLLASNRQEIMEKFADFKQRGWVNNVELQLVRKDGSTRWFNLSATAIRDEAGTFVMTRSTLFDISDRKRIEAERIQAEAALRESEEKFRQLAENIEAAFWMRDGQEQQVIYISPAYETIWQQSCESLYQNFSNWIDSIHTDDRSRVETAALELATVGHYDQEYRIVRPDGSTRWIRDRAFSIKNEAGELLRIAGLAEDITDRKLTEIALQQQTREEQLRWNITQTIRQSLDLGEILRTTVHEVRQTLQGDRVAVYRFQPDWSGDFIAESVRSGWVNLVGSEVQKAWEDTYLQETRGGRFQSHETFIVPDIYQTGLQPCHIQLLEQFQAKAYVVTPIFSGETLWGLLAIYQNAAPRDWQSWEVELLNQIASQLSIAIQQAELYRQLQIELQERQQTTAVIREAERRWRSLLNNVQLLVVGLDQSGRINYVNPFFLTLTGYQETEVLGNDWFSTFLPRSRQPMVQTIFSQVIDQNAHPYYKDFILTKTGEERFIAWNNTRLQDSSGNAIGTISIGEDITAQQKVDQMKKDFISVVSHELRTPLTSIRGSLGLVAGGVYDKKPEKMKEMIAIAARQSDRLVRLVNDILDLRRLESGQAKFHFKTWAAVDLIQQSVDVMRSQADDTQITLSISPAMVEVWADADAIVQTLTNLLSNAIKFSPPHTTITLTATLYSPTPPTPAPLRPLTLFSVQDQGRGIPADQLESIFGQFQQVDVSDSREKGGTGLGLAICRTIIEQHGGKIWVESMLEQGSTFYFTVSAEDGTSVA